METHYSTGQKWKGKSCGSQEKNLLQESSAPLKATATTALLNECCKWECKCWGLGEGSWPSNHSCHRQRIPSLQAEQCPPYPWIWLWAASVCPEVSIGMPILRVLTLQTPPEPLLLRLFHQPAHLSLWILPYRTASRKDSSRSLCLRMKLFSHWNGALFSKWNNGRKKVIPSQPMRWCESSTLADMAWLTTL